MKIEMNKAFWMIVQLSLCTLLIRTILPKFYGEYNDSKYNLIALALL